MNKYIGNLFHILVVAPLLLLAIYQQERTIHAKIVLSVLTIIVLGIHGYLLTQYVKYKHYGYHFALSVFHVLVVAPLLLWLAFHSVYEYRILASVLVAVMVVFHVVRAILKARR